MVWDHINPDIQTPEPLPVKPVYPVLAEKPTAEQASIWNTQKSDYDARMEIYQRVMLAIRAVGNAVTASINADYQVFLKEEGSVTLHDRLVALKKHIARDNRAREMRVTAQYESLKKITKRMSVDGWVIRFTRVATEAKRLQLPCVDKDRALVDFIDCVSTWEPTWSISKMDQVLDAEEGKAPSLGDLIKSFQTRRRYHSAKKTLGTALGAKKPCHLKCVCREYHWWSECPYLNE
ncbi:hypothetical protein PV04_01381 [Phialophora macrospora]|uniref:Uncharacterized protein n=1 Tax=Phialophora macrospora TaxID=1851006 RepID=A0A0D2FXN9_9EURO|nr:hypothetical protein PV04_01381 [Phialophora macrospora]